MKEQANQIKELKRKFKMYVVVPTIAVALIILIIL